MGEESEVESITCSMCFWGVHYMLCRPRQLQVHKASSSSHHSFLVRSSCPMVNSHSHPSANWNGGMRCLSKKEMVGWGRQRAPSCKLLTSLSLANGDRLFQAGRCLVTAEARRFSFSCSISFLLRASGRSHALEIRWPGRNRTAGYPFWFGTDTYANKKKAGTEVSGLQVQGTGHKLAGGQPAHSAHRPWPTGQAPNSLPKVTTSKPLRTSNVTFGCAAWCLHYKQYLI